MKKLTKNYKLKTHKGTKKRYRITGGGKLVKLRGRLTKKNISKHTRRSLGKLMPLSDTYINLVGLQLKVSTTMMKKAAKADKDKANKEVAAAAEAKK